MVIGRHWICFRDGSYINDPDPSGSGSGTRHYVTDRNLESLHVSRVANFLTTIPWHCVKFLERDEYSRLHWLFC
jgi:hypothetical protein